MSRSEPPYGLLYEDWVFKSRKVEQQIAETPDDDTTELRRLAGQCLVIRAGKAGTLQLMSQDAEAGRAWVEKEDQTDARRKAFAALQLDDETLRRLQPRQSDSEEETRPMPFRESAIDDFLRAYPDALRRDDESEDESTDEDDDGQDDGSANLRVDVLHDKASRHDPHQASRSAKRETAIESHAKTESDSRASKAAPNNPYAAKPQVTTESKSNDPSAQFYATIDYPQQQYTQPQETVPPHGFPRDRSNGPWNYERPDSRGNPFQTASDLARAENARPPQPPLQQQQQQSGFNPYANPPYRENSVASSPPPPPAPVIRESLKRKYQPPIRKAPAAANQTAVATASTNNIGGVRQGPTAKQSDNAAHPNDADDDELPEPLQRFGKELVQKIRDEIMDAGEIVTFDDIAGLADAKQTVQEVVCWPMKRPDLFTGLRRAPNGLLLFGPPGTGKTLIGKAIAHESGATFFSISSSSLTSKWIGEGEKLVRTLFAVAAFYEPSVVFIDEIDSLLTQRKADENEASRRIKTEFLVQLDGTGTGGQGRVLMIGATNRPQELDEAARRRFTKRLYIPLPEESDREALLRVLLAKNKHGLAESEILKIAKDTSGFSGADLKALCADAAMGPIRALGARALEVDCSEVPPISYKHFRQSLRSMNPSVAPGDLEQYIAWDELYGNKRAVISDDFDEDDEVLE